MAGGEQLSGVELVYVCCVHYTYSNKKNVLREKQNRSKRWIFMCTTTLFLDTLAILNKGKDFGI